MEQIKESLSVLLISPLRDEYARLLWCIFIAVLLCGAYLFYRRVTVCRALKSLLEKECFSEDTAKDVLLSTEITINVSLGDGDAEATAWGCDLTYDYVKINGDYRT